MNCRKCPSLCASRTKIVLPDLPEFGRPCRLLVIGEAPGADEDREGRGFVGRAGRTLHRLLGEHGLHRGYDYGCANVVRCRTPENRKPTSTEIKACLPFFAETILRARPRALLLVGRTPSTIFCGPGSLTEIIERLRPYWINDLYAAEPELRRALSDVRPRIFAMPHTSPLAWNRNAPDGRKWSVIGEEVAGQMALFLNDNKRHQDGAYCR